MSVTLLAALLVQAASVTLLRHRLGRQWLRHPATVVILVSVVYQGVSPALLTIPAIAGWNYFRLGIQPGFADDATLLLAAGMLAFTVGFLSTRPELSLRDASPDGVRAAARALDWRWLAAACVPLAFWTFQGRGYNGFQSLGATSSASTDLASTFFVVMVALTATGFLLRFGGRWFLPVLVVQSGVLAAAGERTPIITDAITVILVLTLAGVRPRPRQLCAAVAIAVVAMLAITGLRAQQGRTLFYRDSGVTARLSALGESIISFGGPSASGTASPNLVTQAAVRLDGVDWTAAILQSVHFGQPRLPAAWAAQSLLIVVPSSVWSAKLSQGTLNPSLLETQDSECSRSTFCRPWSACTPGISSRRGWCCSWLSSACCADARSAGCSAAVLLPGWSSSWARSSRRCGSSRARVCSSPCAPQPLSWWPSRSSSLRAGHLWPASTHLTRTCRG